MYVYTNSCMHAITINEEEAMNLKEGWEGYMGRVWREEREGISVVI